MTASALQRAIYDWLNFRWLAAEGLRDLGYVEPKTLVLAALCRIITYGDRPTGE